MHGIVVCVERLVTVSRMGKMLGMRGALAYYLPFNLETSDQC